MRGNVIAYTTNDYNVEAGSGQLNAGVSFPGAGSANRNAGRGQLRCYHAELPWMMTQTVAGVRIQLGWLEYFYRANNVAANPQFYSVASDDYRIKAGTT